MVKFENLIKPEMNKNKNANLKRSLCVFSVLFAFSIGFFVGILIPIMCFKEDLPKNKTKIDLNHGDEFKIENIFLNNSFGNLNLNQNLTKNEFSTVSFIENFETNNLIENGIFWGKKIENLIPKGFNENHHKSWKNFINTNTAVKLENGCGRMQNRLVIFENGFKGCIRYRQNIDQIQGELFSFYLGQILKLNNLAPSIVSVVNLKDDFFKNIVHDISLAQWNSNKPIVLTKYIENLDSANIPKVFKSSDKHLNKFDVKKIIDNELETSKSLIELAQWCDLIIFDYLTANLDRVVNNLFNYQWNVNIMEAPAHNLAKNSNSNLLVFLDNESGLLHGYRLLQKYEKYHSILLDNLCMFRKQTVNIIKDLKFKKNVGVLLKEMFDRNNDGKVKDVLPTLPEKSIKTLNERIEKVYNQILKCESIYSDNR
nr:extracellular serine/threonine protein kinase four-jointed [Onthophagus taurus]